MTAGFFFPRDVSWFPRGFSAICRLIQMQSEPFSVDSRVDEEEEETVVPRSVDAPGRHWLTRISVPLGTRGPLHEMTP